MNLTVFLWIYVVVGFGLSTFSFFTGDRDAAMVAVILIALAALADAIKNELDKRLK